MFSSPTDARSYFGSCIQHVFPLEHSIETIGFKSWHKNCRRQQMVFWKSMFSRTWNNQCTTIVHLVEFFQNEWRVVSHTKIMGIKKYCRNMFQDCMAHLGTIWGIRSTRIMLIFKWPGSNLDQIFQGPLWMWSFPFIRALLATSTCAWVGLSWWWISLSITELLFETVVSILLPSCYFSCVSSILLRILVLECIAYTMSHDIIGHIQERIT